MAARHQGKNKNRRMKKKKPQKKGQLARKKQKRLQPKKQKKRQATRAMSRTVLSISSPRIFATKILRHLPKVRMETKARGLMKTLLMDVFNHMSREVESLRQNKQPPTVDPDDVRAAFREVMTRQLAKHSAEPTDVGAAFQEAVAKELAMHSAEPTDIGAAFQETVAKELAMHSAEPPSSEIPAV